MTLTGGDHNLNFNVWEETRPNTRRTHKLHADVAVGKICSQDPSTEGHADH